MSIERDPATLLRDAMAAETRSVTATPAFTDRVLAAADQPPRQAAWQGWVLPAAAAALVAILVAAALIGTSLIRTDRQPPASRTTPPVATTSPAPSPSGSTSRPAPSSSPSSAPSRTSGGPPIGVGPAGGAVPVGFRAVDLTWISDSAGWALGTAPCGQPPCTSVVRTTDGGKSWVGIPAPKAYLAQTDSCPSACDLVSGLRFATAKVGYAFGPSALFMTTDGGATWVRQPGGSAYSLEVVAGSVLRVTGQAPACAPGCTYGLQRAAIGGTDWQPVALPSGGQTSGAQLAASGRTVVLATYGHVAGGAENATSVLFASTDGGSSWRKVGEPCPQRTGSAGEVDTVAVAVASDESISGLCAARGGDRTHFTVTSTDGGAHFAAAPPTLGAAAGTVFGAASAKILLVSLDQLYRSTDGGQHWQKAGNDGHGPASAVYVGFESATVGRVLGQDASGAVGSTTVWRTDDAGRTWTSSTFR